MRRLALVAAAVAIAACGWVVAYSGPAGCGRAIGTTAAGMCDAGAAHRNMAGPRNRNLGKPLNQGMSKTQPAAKAAAFGPAR